MSSYSISNLSRDVRIALDQNNISSQLITSGDIDTLTLDEIIESKIPDAVRFVDIQCPLRYLGAGTAFPNASKVITWESQAGYGPGSVVLPADFLRLICFKMSDWDHPVFVPIEETDPLYAVQRSRFGGVRGNPQKPVCAIVNRSSGLTLEFYSCAADSNAAVSMASYVPIPTVSSGAIEISDLLVPAVIYQAAGLTAQALNDMTVANAFYAQAKELMQ